MLVLSRSDVEQLLDLDRLVDALGAAMAELSAGRASVPPRVAAMVEEAGGLLAAMPAYLPSARVLETKLVSLFPGNAGSSLPTHQALIACFDPSTGEPVALMDASYVTEVRTAAGSALSVRLLARQDATVLAVLGTGVQARAHARAVARVRPIREIRIAGRDPVRTRRLSDSLAEEMGISVRGRGSYAEAIEGADVVCACTHAPEPVVRREWVSPGMHITSVGLNREGPEVDAATVRDSVLVVESRQSVLAGFPAGAAELRADVRDPSVTDDHIHAEIGEIVAGLRPGRTSAEQITLYKSVGVGVQDAAAAALVLEAARASGAGADVEI
jgi:ornithine cyclodeaminase/alanine dehydrogenase-like protein (mu-crystallin family)